MTEEEKSNKTKPVTFKDSAHVSRPIRIGDKVIGHVAGGSITVSEKSHIDACNKDSALEEVE